MVESIKKSQKQEKRGAKSLGGRVTPASGSLDGFKGDVKTDTELVEFKRTDKKSLSLKAEWLEKIYMEAWMQGRQPLLGVEIGGRNWIMLEEYHYVELRTAYETMQKMRSGEAADG